MFTRLSLRLRVFLFFLLIAAGGAAIAAGALYLGWSRAGDGVSSSPFVTAFAVFAFANLGLSAAIWLLFDENVAKPIEKLAAGLRLRAHAGVDKALETDEAKYLGDLAPAANAVSTTLSEKVVGSAAEVARATERARADAARLAAVLTEIPVATILANAKGEIVLYDGQAAEILARFAPPRLKSPLSDYFAETCIAKAMAALAAGGAETSFTLESADGSASFDARLKALEGDGFLMIVEEEAARETPAAARPMVYDFELMDARRNMEIDDAPLRDLCFVVFDTETTGLSPEVDDVVQIAAARVVNGRVVEAEIFDELVNPGRPIPPGASKVHGVYDADVAGAPDFSSVCRRFHAFARDAVLVAHNAPFDIAFLRKAETEMGAVWRNPVLDTVLLSAACFGVTEEHSLDALCERLAVEIPEADRHTALGDARATAAALVKLLPVLEARSLSTFGEVFAECRRHGRLLEAADLRK